MVIKNGTIIACTNSELYDYWLAHYDDVMSYPEYKVSVINAGTEVEDD